MDNLSRFHRVYPKDYPAASQPRSGQGSPPIKRIRVDLGTARDDVKMSASGSVLWAYRGSSLAAQLDIKLNEQSNDDLTFQQGTMIAGYKFSEFYLTNTAQAGEWLDLIVTVKGVLGFDALNPQVQANEISVTKSSDMVSVADVTVTAAAAAAVVLAANADRRDATIKSADANDQAIRLGDSNIGAARGLTINPGETVVFDGGGLGFTDAIYAYTGAGSDQTLEIIYTQD